MSIFTLNVNIYIYIISVFELHILLKKNYTKNNVSHLMTILSSQNSLKLLYIPTVEKAKDVSTQPLSER